MILALEPPKQELVSAEGTGMINAEPSCPGSASADLRLKPRSGASYSAFFKVPLGRGVRRKLQPSASLWQQLDSHLPDTHRNRCIHGLDREQPR